MPTYKISGTANESSIVYIIQNEEYVGKKSVGVGSYEIFFDSTSTSGVTAVAESQQGQIVGFGEVTAVSGGGGSPNLILPASGAAIKSIQTINHVKMTENSTTKDNTITEVDMDKTMLIVTEWLVSSALTPNEACLQHQLLSSTNVRTTRIQQQDPGSVYYSLLVVEYESGIASIQRGTSGPDNVTISEVDLDKTIVHCLGNTNTRASSTNWNNGGPVKYRLSLTTSTNLLIEGDSESVFSYEVVEFE
jgi:hypothetical protein